MSTGHMSLPERGWLTVMFFFLFFWNSNVIDTVSANFKIALLLSVISMLFLKNLMFLTFNRFVFREPFTVKYSQLLIPKKKAPDASCPSASSTGVKVFAYILRKTDSGRAFCCLGDGSASMNPASCRVRNREGLLSASRAGSG